MARDGLSRRIITMVNNAELEIATREKPRSFIASANLEGLGPSAAF